MKKPLKRYKFCHGEQCFRLIPVRPNKQKYCKVCAKIIARKQKKQLMQDKRETQYLLRTWNQEETMEK